MSDILVKPDNPTAFLNKVGARIYNPYGIIWGLVFEFSDGTKINLSSPGDYNTDPYMPAIGAMQTLWASLPNGCDQINYYRCLDNCDKKMIGLVFYKYGLAIASTDARSFGVMGANWQGNDNGVMSVPKGQVISQLLITKACDYYFSYNIKYVYGITDVNAGPVDGVWTDWSPWSLCSANCGPGLKMHTRTCTNPPPALGGADCVGSDTETQPCNMGICPIDGGWTEWSDWSTCVGDCANGGVGTHHRTRACTNPIPVGTGALCTGPNKETVICPLQNCPVAASNVVVVPPSSNTSTSTPPAITAPPNTTNTTNTTLPPITITNTTGSTSSNSTNTSNTNTTTDNSSSSTNNPTTADTADESSMPWYYYILALVALIVVVLMFSGGSKNNGQANIPIPVQMPVQLQQLPLSMPGQMPLPMPGQMPLPMPGQMPLPMPGQMQMPGQSMYYQYR